MQGDGEHLARPAIQRKKPPWSPRGQDEGYHPEHRQQQRQHEEESESDNGAEEEDYGRDGEEGKEQRCSSPECGDKEGANTYSPPSGTTTTHSRGSKSTTVEVVDVDSDEEDDEDEEMLPRTQKTTTSSSDCSWVKLNEGDGTDDEDDECEELRLSWGARKLLGAAQADQRRSDEQRREESDRRVRFAAEAMQWQERQRHHRQLLQTRFAAVCGKGYKGEGPKLHMVDDKGRAIKTISDSGTNIDLMSYATAQHLHKCGLRYHKCPDNEPRQYVVFGVESAREPILGYMYGQGLVGKVAVVRDVAANLISVTAFTQRGMTVTYTDKEVQIRRVKGDELVFVGPFDALSGLYHLDFIHLMLATGYEEKQQSPIDQEERQRRQATSDGLSFAAGTSAVRDDGEDTARTTSEEPMVVDDGSDNDDDDSIEQSTTATFSKAAQLRGMQFHENMEHVPYSTIARNIETGTWKGLHKDLTPALMRYLARRRDCVICGIARWNETHSKGSGDRRYPVGHTVALDYQGKISPVSKNGETGEFVLTDLGSGFTRRYGERGDKTTVEAALTDWCSYFLSHGHVVKEARHDSGSVEVGAKFIAAARRLGVCPIATAPGDPEKRIERRVQTHKNDIAGILARTRLLEANDWDIASTHACLLRSTMTCAASQLQGDGTKSPYELVTGKVPRIDVFQKYGLGDIGVVKKADAKKPGYGGHKNEAVQIVGFEIDDVKAVRVEIIGTRTRLRRGGVRKLFLRATEMNKEEQEKRKVTYTDNDGDKSLTFTIEGGGDVVVESARQLAVQEMELATRSSEEEAESVARRMQLRRDEQRDKQAAGKESAPNREGVVDKAGPEAVEVETTQDQLDREETPEGWYWPWPEEDEPVANFAFWKAFLAVNGMPAAKYASDIYAFTAHTGATFEMDCFDAEEDENSGTRASGSRESGSRESGATRGSLVGAEEGDGVLAGQAYAATKSRSTPRDATNPSQRMINNDEELASMWHPSMVKERTGIFNTSHEVTEEYARKFGVTRHVTARSTKRDGTLKTRFAIDGRHEINQGKFPNRDALYSPAMDEELLRLSLQYAATLNMDIGKSDVVQCFTHNPMETARFKRKLIVYMDEYESGVPGGQYREFDSVSYGTADASSEWYINMSRELMGQAKGMGLSRSVHHPCLFYKGSVKTEDLIMVSVATDDMLRLNLKTDKSKQAMAEFKTALADKWPVTHEDGDDFKEILGVAVERGPNNEIRCTQPAEMRKIREAFFGDGDIPEVMVPLHPEIETAGNETGGAMFEGDDDSEEAREGRSTLYRSLLGKLGYIRMTRLDVLHTLSVLAERAHRPARRDVHGLYWLAAYLLTTAHVPLTFHPVDSEDAMNEQGVLEWTLFGDCSWATRAGFTASCVAQMVVHGNIRTADQLERKPYTAPVIAKTGKETGPAAISAAAGEMTSSVAVLKSNTAVRGMAEELAGVAEAQPSTERMPRGCARPSPLCMDNASNVITIGSETGKKAKGMRLLARSIAFIQYHVDEGSAEVVSVTSEQQRANPLTKAIRSASVHFRESEWLLGTSTELEDMQAMAEERGRSKRSLRPEVLMVAGFAGFGALGSKGDFIWAKRATELREMGDLSEEEVDEITKRNTTANSAPEGGRSFTLRAMIREREPALEQAKRLNKSSRRVHDLNRRWDGTTHDGVSDSITDLAALIFRTDEWMRAPPPQEEDDEGGQEVQEQTVTEGGKKKRKRSQNQLGKRMEWKTGRLKGGQM